MCGAARSPLRSSGAKQPGSVVRRSLVTLFVVIAILLQSPQTAANCGFSVHPLNDLLEAQLYNGRSVSLIP